MVPSRSFRLALLLSLPALLFACKEPTHEERVAEARSKYSVEITACVPEPTSEPAAPQGDAPAGVFDGETDATGSDVAEEAGGEDAAASDAAAEGEGEVEGDGDAGEEMAAEPMEPAVSSVLCDVVVRYDDRDPLPGITIDVVHADPFEKPKNTFREYIETDGLLRGEPRQISLVLDVPGFEEGDLIYIEPIQPSVPEAERSEYREYQP